MISILPSLGRESTIVKRHESVPEDTLIRKEGKGPLFLRMTLKVAGLPAKTLGGGIRVSLIPLRFIRETMPDTSIIDRSADTRM